MTFSAGNSRLGVGTWSSEQDVPTRTQFDANFQAIDLNAALVTQGVEASLPPQDSTPNNQFYFATDTRRLWFNPGAGGWVVVGSKVTDLTATTFTMVDAVTGSVTLTLTAGRLRRPVGDAPVILTLPGGIVAQGGTFAVPSYVMTAGGIVVAQGALWANGATAIVLTMPRPADLRDHSWMVRVDSAPALAALQGSTGQMTITNFNGSGIGHAYLDGITYVGE